MTVVNRNLVPVAPQPPQPLQPTSLEVRWSCMLTKWADRFGLFTNGQRHGKVVFTISLSRDEADESRCTIAAWLMLGDRRKVVLAAEQASCEVLHEGNLTHVDVTAPESSTRLLALSLHGEQLIFAQSPLLHQAGFTGGSYDPPTCFTVSSNHAAASA